MPINSKIDYLIEPSYLSLCWQKADPENNLRYSGSRYVVGKIRRDNNSYTLEYFFKSNDFIALKKNGVFNYVPFSPDQETHTNQVLETFMRRIPPSTRIDYSDFLEFYGLEGNGETFAGQDFALLGYVGAKSPSDGFSLVHPFDTIEKGQQFPIEIAGFRNHEFPKTLIENNATTPIKELVGQHVEFHCEPENQYDCNAVKIMLDDKIIGHVNCAQTAGFRKQLNNGISITGKIIRVNGQIKQPNILVMVKVND